MYKKEPLKRIAARMRRYRARVLTQLRKDKERELTAQRASKETSFRERLEEFYQARNLQPAAWILSSEFFLSPEMKTLTYFLKSAGITPALSQVEGIETATLSVDGSLVELVRPRYFLNSEKA